MLIKKLTLPGTMINNEWCMLIESYMECVCVGGGGQFCPTRGTAGAGVDAFTCILLVEIVG